MGDIIDELVAGKSGPELAGTEFKMSGLSDVEKTAAMAYVSYDASADLMSYDASGQAAQAAANSGGPTQGWATLNNWGTADEASVLAMLVTIENNPGGVYMNGHFGSNNWQHYQDTGGIWRLEFQPK